MKLVNSNVSNLARAALLCAFGSALISLPAPSNAAGTTPTIGGGPTFSVPTGSDYSSVPRVIDTESSRCMRFEIDNKPAWASFDETTGRLWGRPDKAGTYGNISIRVVNWCAHVTNPTFSITVVPGAQAAPANVAPTISGQASTAVNAGTAYSFTPAAASAGNATLDWIPPTENTDGSVLTDLAGYNVHYGTSPDKLTQVVKLANPGLSSYVLDNLTTGTWYFAITSYAMNGTESSASGVVSTTIL